MRSEVLGYGPVRDLGVAVRGQPAYVLSSHPNLYASPALEGLPRLPAQEILTLGYGEDAADLLTELGLNPGPMDGEEAREVLQMLRDLSRLHGSAVQVSVAREWQSPDFLLGLLTSAPVSMRPDYQTVLLELGARLRELAEPCKRLVRAQAAELSARDFGSERLTGEHLKTLLHVLKPPQRDRVLLDVQLRLTATPRLCRLLAAFPERFGAADLPALAGSGPGLELLLQLSETHPEPELRGQARQTFLQALPADRREAVAALLPMQPLSRLLGLFGEEAWSQKLRASLPSAEQERLRAARDSLALVEEAAPPGSVLEHLAVSLDEQESADMAEVLLQAYREELAIARGPTAFPGLNLLSEALRGADRELVMERLQGELRGLDSAIRQGFHTTGGIVELLHALTMLDGSVRGRDPATEEQYWKEACQAAEQLRAAQVEARRERLRNAGPYVSAELNRALNRARAAQVEPPPPAPPPGEQPKDPHREAFDLELKEVRGRFKHAGTALQLFQEETRAEDSLRQLIASLGKRLVGGYQQAQQARGQFDEPEELRATLTELDLNWTRVAGLAAQLESRYRHESGLVCPVCSSPAAWGDSFCPGCGRHFRS